MFCLKFLVLSTYISFSCYSSSVTCYPSLLCSLPCELCLFPPPCSHWWFLYLGKPFLPFAGCHKSILPWQPHLHFHLLVKISQNTIAHIITCCDCIVTIFSFGEILWDVIPSSPSNSPASRIKHLLIILDFVNFLQWWLQNGDFLNFLPVFFKVSILFIMKFSLFIYLCICLLLLLTLSLPISLSLSLLHGLMHSIFFNRL